MKSWTFVSTTSDKRCKSIRIETALMEVATRSQQTHGMTGLPSRHAPSRQPTPRGERIVQPHIRVPPQPRVLAPPPRVHQPNQPTLSLPTSNAWIHHHHRCSRHQQSSAENPQISRTSPFSRMVGFLRGTVRGGGRGRAVTRARAGGGVEASSHVCARTHAERAVRA